MPSCLRFIGSNASYHCLRFVGALFCNWAKFWFPRPIGKGPIIRGKVGPVAATAAAAAAIQTTALDLNYEASVATIASKPLS
ncbi:hypothetical protein SDJN03_27903, partial [Cucurbita argyrosperma subsp. sororia]